jgi:hypothetical protein
LLCRKESAGFSILWGRTQVKMIDFDAGSVAIELSEFDLMLLAALVERG